ncbi:MAG: AAA family ATPase [Bryobacteraceae bacterium]|jgi:hypothetical protein
MARETLNLKNIGPIREADIKFGDLTVLVGPQATGKSIFLQFLKLLVDAGPIFRTLRTHGLDWDRKADSFLQVYLGEGMGSLWQPGKSEITWCGVHVSLDDLVRSRKKGEAERTFFIPAQRVLALSREGWLRPFTDYRAGDPFTVRDFSEKLRVQMEAGLGRGQAVFPQPGRLKSEIRDLLSRTIFSGFQLELEKSGPQKRLVLSDSQHSTKLPFMVWSAGQREFVPLLLGLYWLLPPTKVKRRKSIQWVIIEELEMGLHPQAIETMLVIILDLLWRDYRVCLSTHSPHVLDLLWALRNLRAANADPTSVLDIFRVKKNPPTLALGETALRIDAKVYYFDPTTRDTRDISNLDPAADEKMEAGWGGLTELSGRAADIVAKAVESRGGHE